MVIFFACSKESPNKKVYLSWCQKLNMIILCVTNQFKFLKIDIRIKVFSKVY